MAQVKFGDDFGQKVDLTASIRNILRNYPEGTAILKELVQNADDAGAKTVRFCLDHRNHPNVKIADPALAQFQGPALLVYNDAVFAKEDFDSIQRIGDSLKNIGTESKTKIGRFGIGFNAVYHWTELPSFISDHFLVMLDPSARYLPNVNPNNPGKKVDWLKDKTLLTQLEDQFRPYQIPDLSWSQPFPGTLFRLPLRTQEQAETSQLSKRALDVNQVSEVMHSLAAEAVSMLLFLRKVERIEITEWRPFSTTPETIFTCDIANINASLRVQRSFDGMLGVNRVANIAAANVAVADFTLEIRTVSRDYGNTVDTWRVCTQFGGGQASQIARMSENSHLKLVPVAGVAACMGIEGQELITRQRRGAAYCFLPLPIQTELPVMVNGFFELSSNRRDIWQESVDMTGDGNTRAKWNEAILRDIVASCYVRLLKFAKDLMGFSEQFESLWPSHHVPRPWATVMLSTLSLARQEKLLLVSSNQGCNGKHKSAVWIEPVHAIILPLQSGKALSEPGSRQDLLDILCSLNVFVIHFNNSTLHETLIQTSTCTQLATPTYLRALLRSLSARQREEALEVTKCRFLVHYCLQDVSPSMWVEEWHNLPILPLLDGSIGTMTTFTQDQYITIEQVVSMGYSLQESIACLVEYKFNLNQTCEVLLTEPTKRLQFLRQSKRWYYIFANNEEWEAFGNKGIYSSTNHAIFVDTTLLHPEDVEVLKSIDCQRAVNLRNFAPPLLKDVVPCLLPPICLDTNRPVVLQRDLSEAEQVSLRYFSQHFWKYASKKSAIYISAIAESYAILPGENYTAWYPLSKLSNLLAPKKSNDNSSFQLSDILADILRKLNVPLLEMSVFDEVEDVQTLPKVFWEYIHSPHRVGVLGALGCLLRNKASTVSTVDVIRNNLSSEEKNSLRLFLSEGTSSELTESLLAIFKALPIFPTVSQKLPNNSLSANADEHKDIQVEFVSLANNKWVTLPSFADIPLKFLNISENVNTNNIILHETTWELTILTALQVRQLSWGEFYQHYILQFAKYHYERDANGYETLIAKMILDLPSITRGQKSNDKAFIAFLKSTAFVPCAMDVGKQTVETGLCRIEDLYDPTNNEMQLLLPAQFFPSSVLCVPEILTIFKSLGLRTIIDWRGIVDCARSVEAISTRFTTNVIDENEDIVNVPSNMDRKRTRGETLLQYLDANITRLLGEEKKETAVAPSNTRGFSLFGTISSLFSDKNDANSTMSDAKREEMEIYIAQLRTIAWVPILQQAPDKFMPWKYDNSSHDEKQQKEIIICLSPDEVAPLSEAWYCSASHGILSSSVTVKEASLRRILGWQGNYSVQTLAVQLRAIASKFQEVQKCENGAESQDFHLMRQRMATIVPELYARLDNTPNIENVRGFLEQAAWIWVGDNFVSISEVAITFPVHAAPYLYQLPEEIKVYSRLMKFFPWKYSFSYRDYINTLRNMAIETGYQFETSTNSQVETAADTVKTVVAIKSLSEAMIDVAVALVSLISNETTTTLQSHVIFVPDINAKLAPSGELVNDDVPWLQGVENMTLRSACRLVHPNISSKVAEKVGVKSMRLDILEKTKDNNLFRLEEDASQKQFESFGQAESLTNRLKTILDLYPDGSQILNELVQNADDAGATAVKIIIDENSYGTESLMDRRLEPLQGPSLLFYNNTTFSETDFKSLASVGQGSKIEKLATTGRFGLGFNSTYHLTDTPTFVSGDYFVFFDPHCTYVPGATINQPGIKFRYTDSNLGNIFPNQFEPFKHCAFNMDKSFPGTIFRFPLRSTHQARSSGISRRAYKLEDLASVVEQMIEQLPYILLFLRSVKRVEIYRCYEGQRQETLLYAAQAEDQGLDSRGDMSLMEYFEKKSNPLQFSRDSFYAKLLATQDSKLPSMSITKQILVEKYWNQFSADQTIKPPSDEVVTKRQLYDYEYVFGLVGGNAKQLACSEQARHMKLVPFGGVAACTKCISFDYSASIASSSQIEESAAVATETLFPLMHQGHAFCFLPLPIQTKLPVLVNAYFELSSNRRDIWRGDDTKGESRLRSEWNKHILQEVIPQLYASLFRHLTKRFVISSLESSRQLLQLLPSKPVPAPWDSIRDSLLPSILQVPLFWTPLQGGKPIAVNDAVFIDGYSSANNAQCDSLSETERKTLGKLHSLLLADNLPMVACDFDLKQWLEEGLVKLSTNSFGFRIDTNKIVNSSFLRNHFRVPTNSKSMVSHPLFERQELAKGEKLADAAFLLQYALRDFHTTSHEAFFRLKLLPIQTGEIVTIDDFFESFHYYLLQQTERKLLSGIADQLIIVSDESINAISDITVELNKTLIYLDEKFQSQVTWNIRRMDDISVVKLVTEGIRNRFVHKTYFMESHNYAIRNKSTISDSWIQDMWKYLLDEQKLELYEGTIPLIPVLSPNFDDQVNEEAVLVLMDSSAPVLYIPTFCSATSASEKGHMKQQAVVQALWKIGIYILDESVAGPFLNHVSFQSKCIRTTGIGSVNSNNKSSAESSSVWLDALMAIGEKNLKVLTRSWTPVDCVVFHNIVLDNMIPLHHSILSESQQEMLLSLPIWLTHKRRANFNFPDIQELKRLPEAMTTYMFTSLQIEAHFLPPLEITTELLDPLFVVWRHANERAKYEKLGLQSISFPKFVVNDLLPKLSGSRDSTLSENEKLWSSKFILSHLSRLLQEMPHAREILLETAFVRNDEGKWEKPTELYDFDISVLNDILPRSCFPDTNIYRDMTLAQSLRILGLRRDINAAGILIAAKSIEQEQKLLTESSAASVTSNIEGNISTLLDTTLFARYCSLMRYLESHIHEILREVDPKGLEALNVSTSSSVEDTNIVSTPSANNTLPLGGRWAQELRSILWVAVYTKPPLDAEHKGLPWPKMLHVTPFAAPMHVTNKRNLWIASSSMRVASVDVNSSLLQTVLGWDKSIPGSIIAIQLINLASDYMILQTMSDTIALENAKGKYDEIYPTILRSLFDQFSKESIVQRNHWIKSLVNKPVIWTTSGNFIETNRVSFSSIANVNVEPFLYIATSYMHQYKEMLLLMGVRESFDCTDLAMMIRRLFDTHRQRALSMPILEDILGVITVLHRMLTEKFRPSSAGAANVIAERDSDANGLREESEQEQSFQPDVSASSWSAEAMRDEIRNLGAIFLPDANNVLHPASELTYNDAPWISATHVVERYQNVKFLHPRLENSIGEMFGCRSFRDVLFAGETVFCPSMRTIAEAIGTECNLFHTMNDMMYVADSHDCLKVEFFYDSSTYNSESLLHPGLAGTQGPALLVHFVGRALSFEEISKWLTIPTLTTSAGSVTSAMSLARGGYRLLSSFAITDCLQILTGSDMYIFDPTGSCLEATGTNNNNSHSATATVHEEGKAQKFNLLRNRQTSQSSSTASSTSSTQNLILGFSDQFEPYFALSDNIKHDLTERSRIGGTVFRLPLRTAVTPMCDHIVDETAVREVFGHFKSNIFGCLLFANQLMSVTLSHKTNTASTSSTVAESGMVVDLGVDLISDPALRSSRWQLSKAPGWDRQGMTNLFISFKPVEKSYKLSFTVRLDMNGWMKSTSTIQHRLKQFASPDMFFSSASSTNHNSNSNVVCYPEVWLVLGSMGHEPIRQLALSEPYKSLRMLPLIHIALPLLEKQEMMAHHVGMDDGWLCHMGSVMQATGFPFHVEAQFLTVNGCSLYASSQRSNMKIANEVVMTWNNTLMVSMVNEMYVKFLRDWKQQLEDTADNKDILEMEGLYKYFIYSPRLSDIVTKKSSFLQSSCFHIKISTEKMFILDRKVFLSMDRVIFPTKPFSLPVLTYLRSTMPLARTPMQLGLDLKANRHVVPAPTLLTAPKLRALLVSDSNIHWRRLSTLVANDHNRVVILELLHFTLSDLSEMEHNPEEGDFSRRNIYASLRGCPLLIMADGSVGMFPVDPQRKVCFASDFVLSVLPFEIRKNMIRHNLLNAFPLFKNPLFQESVGLTELNPTFLKDFVSHILPMALVNSKGLMWVDTFDEKTSVFNADMFEKLLYVLWNHVFVKLSFVQLLVLGDIPLLPAISAGRRVLLPVAAMPFLFTPVDMTNVEDDYRNQLKRSIDEAHLQYANVHDIVNVSSVVSSLNSHQSNDMPALPWAWTSERPYQLPRQPNISNTPSNQVSGTTSDHATSVNTVPVGDGTSFQVPQTTVDPVSQLTDNSNNNTSLSTFPMSVETYVSIKKLGVPFLDTLVFKNKPLALQQHEHIQVTTYQHVGKKLLDALHNFGVMYPQLTNVVNTSNSPVPSSNAISNNYPTFDALTFSSLSISERHSLLQELYQAHRAKTFSEEDILRVKQLPLFTNAMDDSAATISVMKNNSAPSTSENISGPRNMMSMSGLLQSLQGISQQAQPQQPQVYWCTDATSVLRNFAHRTGISTNFTSSLGHSNSTAAGTNAVNNTVILQNPNDGSLSDIFRWLQVPELTPALAITSFVLPAMDQMSTKEQAELIETLAAQWDIYKHDARLVDALKNKRFVPMWNVEAPDLWKFQYFSSPTTMEENDYYVVQNTSPLRRCDELIMWTNKELLAVLRVSPALPAYLAPPAWQTVTYLSMFRDLGMHSELNEDILLRIGQDIQHTYDCAKENKPHLLAETMARSRKFLHYLFGIASSNGDNMDATSGTDIRNVSLTVVAGENRFSSLCHRPAFQKTLSKLRIVPILRPIRVEKGGFVVYEEDMAAYEHCVALASNTSTSDLATSATSGNINGSANQNIAALLSFTVLPLLDSDVTPPSTSFSTMGIVHPATMPPKECILTHVKQLIVDSDHLLDRWNHRLFSIVQTFHALFDYFSDLPSGGLFQRFLTAHFPLIPVGHTLVPANRIFFTLPKAPATNVTEDDNNLEVHVSSPSSSFLAPFLYELPRAFASFESFFKRVLSMRESPAVDDFIQVLQKLSGDQQRPDNASSEIALNPNELRAVLTILQLMVSTAATTCHSQREQLLLHQTSFSVPDHRGIMRAVDSVYVTDDLFLFEQIAPLFACTQSCLKAFHPLHPQLLMADDVSRTTSTNHKPINHTKNSASLISVLGIRRLSELIEEKLVTFAPLCDQESATMTEAYQMDAWMAQCRTALHQVSEEIADTSAVTDHATYASLEFLERFLCTENITLSNKNNTDTKTSNNTKAVLLQSISKVLEMTVVATSLTTNYFLRNTSESLFADTANMKPPIYYYDKNKHSLYINSRHEFFLYTNGNTSAASTTTINISLQDKVCLVLAVVLCDNWWGLSVSHAPTVQRALFSWLTHYNINNNNDINSMSSEESLKHWNTLLRHLSADRSGQTHAKVTGEVTMGEKVRSEHIPLLELKPFRGFYSGEIIAYRLPSSVHEGDYVYGRVKQVTTVDATSGVQQLHIQPASGNHTMLLLLSTEVYSFRSASSLITATASSLLPVDNKNNTNNNTSNHNNTHINNSSVTSSRNNIILPATSSSSKGTLAASAEENNNSNTDKNMTMQALHSLLERCHLPLQLQESTLLHRIFELEEQMKQSQVQRLQAQDDWQHMKHSLEKTHAQYECSLCRSNRVSVSFVPCGHTVCKDCSQRLKDAVAARNQWRGLGNRSNAEAGDKCPYCRVAVTKHMTLFFQQNEDAELDANDN